MVILFCIEFFIHVHKDVVLNRKINESFFTFTWKNILKFSNFKFGVSSQEME